MPLGTFFCRQYLGRLPIVLGVASARSLDRGLRKVKLLSREQRRNLLTAVTSSPTLLRKSSDVKPELAVLVDAALAWASKSHTSNDPPSHAVILIHKSFIPQGTDELLYALGESTQLCGLNALVGVVDSVGEGAKGVSVLLASSSEAVTIKTLKGSSKEEVRVGRWHAKDAETETTPMDFDKVMASIRGQPSSSPAFIPPVSREREFVLAIGETEGTQSQAETISQMFPKADILGVTLARTPYINSLFTTLVHNGVVLPSSDVALFRIPRSRAEKYISPTLDHNLTSLTREQLPTITSSSGNLLLELDHKPAMPYLLSLLPSQSEEEKLKSQPLVVKLHLSPHPLGSPCVNVLGGSKSRGAVAIDPLVFPGGLTTGTKVEFAKVNGSYLPSLKLPQIGEQVHVQLEALFPHPEEHVNQSGAISNPKQQLSKSLPQITKERKEFQGIQTGLFSGGSEGGFLVGDGGATPWLCRIAGSRVQLKVTGHQSGERRVPITMKPVHPINLTRHYAQIEAESRLVKIRSYLKAQGLYLGKRVVQLDSGETKTIPVLRQDPKALQTRNRASKTAREQQRERQAALKSQLNQAEPIPSYAEWLLSNKQSPRSASQQEESGRTRLSDSQERLGKAHYESLPPQDRWLLNYYPATEKLILQNKLSTLPYRNQSVQRGTQKFGFRAKERLARNRLTRTGFRAGGFRLINALASLKRRNSRLRKPRPPKMDRLTVIKEIMDFRKRELSKRKVMESPNLEDSGNEEALKLDTGTNQGEKSGEASNP